MGCGKMFVKCIMFIYVVYTHKGWIKRQGCDIQLQMKEKRRGRSREDREKNGKKKNHPTKKGNLEGQRGARINMVYNNNVELGDFRVS